MNENRIRPRKHIYPIIWFVIALFSIYLFLRLLFILFSNEDGQARPDITIRFATSICTNVMEAGSSYIDYYMTGDKVSYSLPIRLLANQVSINLFSANQSTKTIHAQTISAPTSVEKNTISFIDLSMNDYISKEYQLSNGACLTNGHSSEDFLDQGLPSQLQIGYLEGDIQIKEFDEDDDNITETMLNPDNGITYTLEQLKDISFLVRNFYIVDPSTKVTDQLFDAEVLVGKDMTIKQQNDQPQILIYHTHSQETYADSRAGKQEDTVVGVGSELTRILSEKYGYNVIHDTSIYDLIDGQLDRSKAYNMAEVGITQILEENPTIEVVIDLHRDGSSDGKTKRSVLIDGKEVAQIMLFNGLSRDQNGPIVYLDNPNLQNNLAFSLQLHLKAIEQYPGFFFKNYLKCYRYNLHLRPKSLLMELGTESNSLQSAKNAMPYFAEILNEILQEK